MSLEAPRLILASSSPRRRELLREAGYAFEIDPADIDEEAVPPGMSPSDVARYLAETKAKVVAARHPDDVVLAADTVVTFGEKLLGKPKDAAEAKRMLQLLSGTTHLVITGVAVMHPAKQFTRITRVMSAVRMRMLSAAEIDRYVASNEWQGKAGGYGIQDVDQFPADHPASTPFITRQAGSKTNIVGLPMTVTKQLLSEAGIKPERTQ
jgi:septum formation protein